MLIHHVVIYVIQHAYIIFKEGYHAYRFQKQSFYSITMQMNMDTGLEALRKIHDESRRCNARSEFFCAMHDETNITQRAAVCMLYNLMQQNIPSVAHSHRGKLSPRDKNAFKQATNIIWSVIKEFSSFRSINFTVLYFQKNLLVTRSAFFRDRESYLVFHGNSNLAGVVL